MCKCLEVFLSLKVRLLPAHLQRTSVVPKFCFLSLLWIIPNKIVIWNRNTSVYTVALLKVFILVAPTFIFTFLTY